MAFHVVRVHVSRHLKLFTRVGTLGLGFVLRLVKVVGGFQGSAAGGVGGGDSVRDKVKDRVSSQNRQELKVDLS